MAPLASATSGTVTTRIDSNVVAVIVRICLFLEDDKGFSVSMLMTASCPDQAMLEGARYNKPRLLINPTFDVEDALATRYK